MSNNMFAVVYIGSHTSCVYSAIYIFKAFLLLICITSDGCKPRGCLSCFIYYNAVQLWEIGMWELYLVL